MSVSYNLAVFWCPMFGLSFWEIGVILLVALLVLGPKRLPSLAKTIGKGLRDLRRASQDLRSAIEEPLEEIRQPLQDMRDDLVDTVRHIEQEIEEEASRKEEEGAGERTALDGAGGRTALDGAGERTALEGRVDQAGDKDPELEDRRRDVEALYAEAAREELRAREPGQGLAEQGNPRDLWQDDCLAASEQPPEEEVGADTARRAPPPGPGDKAPF